MRDDFFQNFAEEVFNLDSHIRFVGMASKEGKILGYRYQSGTQNKMTEVEVEESLRPLIMQIHLYSKVREIAGELRYHIGTFNRLYAASIPVRLNPNAEIYVLMSFDLGCRPYQIIEDRVLPLIGRDKDYFM